MRVLFILLIFCIPVLSLGQSIDWRLISNGQKIYEHGYCDQPYIVVTNDGTWVCTFTTSPGQEGDEIQYIVSTHSSDQGKTWSTPVEIEASASGIEASWAMPLVTLFDRIYVFYTFNGDSIRHLPNGNKMRADTHGWYCYRYSEDKGETWSERYRLDMRQTECDQTNDFNGEVQMFWGIGKPVSKENKVWFSFTKLGQYFLKEGEGWVYYSDNILTEKEVSNINWQLLPDGDIGIRNSDLGSIQEEFNIQPMNTENGLYCVYRTTLGQPAHSYSYDNGKTWSVPELMNYANGSPLRNPRACPRLWKCKNGKYLLWYHNNGGKGFDHRNPAWVSGGIEKNGKIYWSQPEILIYGPDHSYETGRFSYPDLVEEEGKYWVSTTQKTMASIHEVPAEFFEKLWGQFDEATLTSDGLVGSFDHPSSGNKLKLTEPLSLKNSGFALDFWIKVDEFKDTILLEGIGAETENMEVALKKDGILEFVMTKGGERVSLKSSMDQLEKGKMQHVAILVDAAAQVCYMLINGSICDGGGKETFGFARLNQTLLDIVTPTLSVNDFNGEMSKLRVYGQPMSTSELVNNYRAEK